MPWQIPAGYEPRPDLKHHLESLGPKMNTPEFDMVIYWQWVHRSLPKYRKTVAQAWADLRMTPEHARLAFERRLIPDEIHGLAVARASEDEDALVG